MMHGQKIIKMKNIVKTYPGVKAVSDVDFTIESGCVHALVGENGAGKSTLMKVLAGVTTADSGEIFINGEKVLINNPHDARIIGISFIEQEFALFPDLSVYRNIFINREYSGKMKGFVDWEDIKTKSRKMLSEIGFDIDVTKTIKDLTTSEQQVIEIAKAIFFGAQFIIMDEPTSSMGDEDKIKFFEIIRDLKKKNIGIIYISHRMDELREIADKITIMRDGVKVGTSEMPDISTQEIIRKMVGRELGDIFYREKAEHINSDVVLEVKNLSKRGAFSDISFKVHSGEVLGFSGLMGSQRTEIARCVYGLDPFTSGRILLNGEEVQKPSPDKCIQNGIALVPEDRKIDGIVGGMSVKENIILSVLSRISKLGWIKKGKVNEIYIDSLKSLSIKCSSEKQYIMKLSGGNQQKCILARCLALKPKLLILDEPTRGIDIGAKQEVHKIISQIAAQGVAVWLISSEMPEIIGACDRIIVLNQGRISGEYSHEDVTQENLMESSLFQKEKIC